MSLKVETKTVHSIDYFDWDKFIRETYPNCPYDSIVSEEEMTNDSTWTSTIKGNLDQEEITKIEAYLFEGKQEEYGEVYTGEILDYLVYRGTLPEGYYNIKISW